MSGLFDPDLFVAATSRWQQSVDLEDFFNRIQIAFGSNREAAWRPIWVRDFREYFVPAAAERLVRWDKRCPRDIFRTGFEPNGGIDSQCNIEEYVLHNQESPFISTARCYRSNECPMRWRPHQTPFTRNRGGFEYEIFAYGGIDVNVSIIRRHRLAGQKEIAFPGGIRREFIRSALEYDSNGHYVRYWINTHFDLNANGPKHSPDLSQIPNHLFPDNVDTVFFDENEEASSDHDHTERLAAAQVQESDGFDDFMTADGSEEEIRFMGAFFKTLSEHYAPEVGREYAINILGTSMVLTCKNDVDLVLDLWQGKDGQRFRCTEQDGFTGFNCVGAGGGRGRYLGYNSQEWLACSATKQETWEQFFVRAHPKGGFQLWMSKDDRLAPVRQIDRTTLRFSGHVG
ncbi:ADP-ribosylation [Trichoderma aethiopicum]